MSNPRFTRVTLPNPTAMVHRLRAALRPMLLAATLGWCCLPLGAQVQAGAGETPWPVHAGAAGGGRYSPLTQIDRGNVGRLEPAWVFRTGEGEGGHGLQHGYSFQATPVVVGSVMYVSTGAGRVFALDAAQGRELWRYDAGLDRARRYAETANRGVAVWDDPAASAGSACARRVFVGTLDARLIAIDGRTGRPCEDFGQAGQLALRDPAWPRAGDGNGYGVTSPPVVARDLVIVGSAIGDNRSATVESGVVRAFDARTGQLRWRWESVPAPLTAANAWAPMALDAERDLLFVATGSAAPDFFGGHRPGDNPAANALVALRASTGQPVWQRQLVHHDLWDYDLPAQPVLTVLTRDGRSVPAVVQATKMGMLFVLDRETGAPLFPIEERAVPRSDVPGERASPTQPFSSLPALARQAPVRPDDAWGLTPWDRGRCRDLIAQYRSEGMYTPPSVRGTIMLPGYAGGSNWGGLAFDPATQTVFANTINIAMVVALIERERYDAERESGRYEDWQFSRQEGTPYGMRRRALLSPLGLPCIAPPWGQMAAVDLRSGQMRWQVPLGTTRGKAPWPLWFNLGMPNLGGPLVTAGGLLFVAAATDDTLRALDASTGQELWSHRLPAGGQASPMSYAVAGRQYVVIAAGGHGGLGTTRGDHLVAFTLPQAGR